MPGASNQRNTVSTVPRFSLPPVGGTHLVCYVLNHCTILPNSNRMGWSNKHDRSNIQAQAECINLAEREMACGEQIDWPVVFHCLKWLLCEAAKWPIC